METHLDCLLIVPPFNSGKRSVFKAFEYTMPPIGLLSIAAWLQQNGISVKILDFTVEKNDSNTIESLLSDFKNKFGNPQWVGITVCTPVAYISYHISDLCKSIFKDSKIVFGGPHITVIGQDVFNECDSVDFLVLGEGEYTLCNLILGNDNISTNLLQRNKKTNNSSISYNVDLSALPMPAYDLLKFKLYSPPPSTLKRKKAVMGIIASRGCPYNCTFCVKTAGSKLRFVPVHKVIAQIKYLKEKFSIEQFNFYDDTITCNYEYIKALCEKLIEENLNIQWSCFARVDTVNLEILGLLKKAGCLIVMYGVESLDENVLKSINKNFTAEQIKKALELTHSVGLESRVSVMIGNPADTYSSIRKTRKEMLKLKADFLQVFIAIPMPGSEFYKNAIEEKRLKSQKWSDYDLSKVLYQHPLFSEKQLFKMQKQFYISFYFRFKYIVRTFGKLDSFSSFKQLLNGFLGFFKIIISR